MRLIYIMEVKREVEGICYPACFFRHYAMCASELHAGLLSPGILRSLFIDEYTVEDVSCALIGKAQTRMKDDGFVASHVTDRGVSYLLIL